MLLALVMIALVQRITCESIQDNNDCCKLAKICNTASSVCAKISICKDALECIDSKADFIKKYGSDQTLDLQDLKDEDLNHNDSDEYDSCGLEDYGDSDDEYLDFDFDGQESDEYDGDYDDYQDYEDCAYEDSEDWDQELGNNEHLEEFRTL